MKVKSRGNGQGSAYKRGTTWTAQVVVGWRPPDDPSHKPIPIKRTKGGFATKKEAIAYCPILLNGGMEIKTQAPRLSEYWDTYRKGEYLNLSDSKQCAYRIAWKKLKAIQDVRVDAFTVEMLRKVVSDTCPTYSPAKDCKSLLSNLFKLAAADGFAKRELPSYIILPPLHEKERQPFTDIEQAALWKLYESGNRKAAIPLLMIYTGMMPGEAMKLRVDSIDLDKRQIVNAGMKTKIRKETPIVIAETIVPLLEDLIQNAQPSGFIWKREEKQWYADYYEALEISGCRRLNPYSCRHTTATALAISEGIAPQTIRRVMRWSTTRMLDRYAHPQMEDALQAANSIKKVLATTDLLPTKTGPDR